jgi:hypothetical protein
LPSAAVWTSASLQAGWHSTVTGANVYGPRDPDSRVHAQRWANGDACAHLGAIRWRTVVVLGAGGESPSSASNDTGRHPRGTGNASRWGPDPRRTDGAFDGSTVDDRSDVRAMPEHHFLRRGRSPSLPSVARQRRMSTRFIARSRLIVARGIGPIPRSQPRCERPSRRVTRRTLTCRKTRISTGAMSRPKH